MIRNAGVAQIRESERFGNAPSELVSDDHGANHVIAAAAACFGESEHCAYDRRARLHVSRRNEVVDLGAVTRHGAREHCIGQRGFLFRAENGCGVAAD